MKEYIENNKIAVTLMELVVAISIVGFILVAAITYNMIGEKFYHSTSKQALVTNDAQYLIEQMGKDIKQATDVSVNVNGDVVTITQLGGKVVTYTYKAGDQEDKGKVYYNSGGEEELFASNVVQFDVSDVNADDSVTVELHLRIGEEGDKSREESHYVGTFFLRNVPPPSPPPPPPPPDDDDDDDGDGVYKLEYSCSFDHPTGSGTGSGGFGVPAGTFDSYRDRIKRIWNTNIPSDAFNISGEAHLRDENNDIIGSKSASGKDKNEFMNQF